MLLHKLSDTYFNKQVIFTIQSLQKDLTHSDSFVIMCYQTEKNNIIDSRWNQMERILLSCSRRIHLGYQICQLHLHQLTRIRK